MFKEGKSVAVHPIRITYKEVPGQTSPLQAGFSVSSRNFKKAVDRNRIKRLLRESYRKQKPIPNDPGVESNDASDDGPGPGPGQGNNIPIAIFIIYTGKELPDYKLVDEKMRLAIQKLADQLRRQQR